MATPFALAVFVSLLLRAIALTGSLPLATEHPLSPLDVASLGAASLLSGGMLGEMGFGAHIYMTLYILSTALAAAALSLAVGKAEREQEKKKKAEDDGANNN